MRLHTGKRASRRSLGYTFLFLVILLLAPLGVVYAQSADADSPGARQATILPPLNVSLDVWFIQHAQTQLEERAPREARTSSNIPLK